MVQSRPQLRSQLFWYILWGAMLVIAAGNTLAPRAIVTGNVGFLVSLLLACTACLQLLWGVPGLSRKYSRLAQVLLLCFVIAQAGQWLRSMKPPSPYRGFDFSAYYLAAKVLPETPQHDLYALPLTPDGRASLNAESPATSLLRTEAEREHLPWATPLLYPPLLPVLVKPLALLPFSSALMGWEVLSAALLLGAMMLALDLGGVRLDARLALILGVGVFSYEPFDDGLFVGQIGPLILFLLTAGVWLLGKGRSSVSALAFATATLIKLTPIMALPVLVFHRRWRWLAAYTAWLAALVASSSLAAGGHGWALYAEFFRQVLPRISSGVPVSANASLAAWMQELFLGYVPRWPDVPAVVPPSARLAGRAVSLAVYGLILVRLWKRRTDRDVTRDLILMVLLGIAVSPISWWHHYTLALLPFLYLWCRIPTTRSQTGDRILLALFLAVGTNLLGFALTQTITPAVQLILAAVTPTLTLALVYRELSPRPAAVCSKSGAGAACPA
jgi:alpha-1,2-mannosyltransferase